jgi:hypothetical protein
VALDAALPAVSTRARPLARGLTARVGLTLVVLGSFAVRIVAAAAHPIPRYFPDEYLYTSIARALAAGHLPEVRGQAVRFPALLEPLLAAPLQALFSPEVAYRLTQMENALLMSLVAVPVYLLARRLSLSARYALACAVFAVAIPDLFYSSFTLADPVAYPLVFGALYFGVAALERPRARTQLAFLALALLATMARAQYVVLPFAFVVAAVALDRRAVLTRHRLPIALLALAPLSALALGPSRLLGIYAPISNLHVNGQFVRWALLDLFLLAISTGIVLVPGALVALCRARGRGERAFSALAVAFIGCVVFQAALFGSNGLDRFQERYLFAVLPLVPLAFGLYLKNGRPARVAVGVLSCVFFVAAARIPLSGYTVANGKSDSPFLIAVDRLEQLIGTGSGALAISLLAALGAAGAVAVSRGFGARISVGAAIAVTALASLAVASSDSKSTQKIRSAALPADPSWIDATKLGDVTLVQTPGSPTVNSIQQLYWNKTITREVTLGPAQPTDPYAPSPRVVIAADGTLRGVGSHLLLETYGATAQFANTSVVASFKTFHLLSAEDAPRLSLLELGRYADGWLARNGRLSLWPDAGGRTRGTLGFSLTLPLTAKPLTVHFGKTNYRVEPGRRTPVTLTVDAHGPFSLAFSSAGGSWRPDLRAVSVLSTPPHFLRAGGSTARVTTSV